MGLVSAVPRRVIIIAATFIIFLFLLTLAPREAIVKTFLEQSCPPINENDRLDQIPASSSTAKFRIKDKVAVITDTQYTSKLLPLILHFHAVLGPDWPIVFYTSEETIEKRQLLPVSKGGKQQQQQQQSGGGSAIWRRAVAEGRIDVRTIPDEFNMTSREGVNLYLSRPWLWEQLAPARHVLVFQADAMLCANAHRTVDDFLEWDWIAATLHGSQHLYNGGLSLRNRTMILDILREGNNWEEETRSGAWTMGGEDVWFSRKMDLRGAHLPDQPAALKFACQHEWHINIEKEPLGYHKVHKNVPGHMKEIEAWCPEIQLAAPGTLEPST